MVGRRVWVCDPKASPSPWVLSVEGVSWLNRSDLLFVCWAEAAMDVAASATTAKFLVDLNMY